MYSTKEIISLFTDAFDEGKREGAVLYNLVSLFADELVLLKDTNDLMQSWRDIDKARGKTLDLIGENINQDRGTASDEVYRILLKSKIARNLSDGTIDTIIQVIATALSADLNEIKLRESWEDNPDALPSIRLMQMPLKRLLESGMDPLNFVRIIQKTVAAGIRVEQIELMGTLRLTAGPGTVANGLSDIDMTVGGTLGAIYSNEKMNELPI